MPARQCLPTWRSGVWSVAMFRDSLVAALREDRSCAVLRMYFYAVTQAGWAQIREPVLEWREARRDRSVSLFVGTDHAITSPAALEEIVDEGVSVRMMLEYEGVFHPKMVWLAGKHRNVIWAGSNNLTREGLLNNVEFALVVRGEKPSREFSRWTGAIESNSVPLTEKLLASYRRQRRKFEKKRAKAGVLTFTWDERVRPRHQEPPVEIEENSLIVEVMPRETGSDGRQLQLPIEAATTFFGVERGGPSRRIRLRGKDVAAAREVTLSMFPNHTARLVLGDLEYRDRPCVVIFRQLSDGLFDYEIVSKSIFPQRYRSLLARCLRQTRIDSRRWGTT